MLNGLLRRSIQQGKPDLNIMFQYNMPLRALAKMTGGAISMGMVEGIVMVARGVWSSGLIRVLLEGVKYMILNGSLEDLMGQG